MGIISKTDKVKLFTGLFSGEPALFPEVKIRLEKFFGPLDFESDIIDFSHTDYYREEFGDNLKRKFYGFSRTLGPDKIYKIKQISNRIEKKFLDGSGKRRVNIDPGYITLSKVVLLTTKDYVHRLYLAGGIYGEITLYYKNKTFNPWPWTYPDYSTKEYVDIFNVMRGFIIRR